MIGHHGDRRTRVLLAVVAGCRTVSAVARRAGLGRSTTYVTLCQLRAEGLVDWERGRHGTLRPLVRVAPLRPGTPTPSAHTIA